MDKSGEAAWSPERVEARLIAAFRALPTHAVFSERSRVVAGEPDQARHATALSWTRSLVPDRFEAVALLTWARCRADGSSVRERFQAMGWKRSTAEKARRRALRQIADALNRQD